MHEDHIIVVYKSWDFLSKNTEQLLLWTSLKEKKRKKEGRSGKKKPVKKIIFQVVRNNIIHLPFFQLFE